jgi:L,D-transpeptidase ErfK/SrfK
VPALRHILVITVFLASGPIAALWASQTIAETLTLPPVDIDLVGQTTVTEARHEDTLLDIARRFDIGQDEIVFANAQVDRWLPGKGTEVFIPSRYILPRAKRTGIVLNVPEMRLYYFPPPEASLPVRVETYPVSIGRMDWATPLGTTRITAKVRNPSWRPPDSIRAEAEASGTPLPELIPAGPDNPLGDYALRLGLPGYLIHSTNRPYGVGMRVTHGCIRMYPEDIRRLFPNVPVGTTVQIVNQPVKIGWLFDTLFIEVHPLLEEHSGESAALFETAMELINSAWIQRRFDLDARAVRAALNKRDGIPVPIAQAADH